MKNLNNKLALSKDTLSNLSENGKDVNGGISGFACFISLEIIKLRHMKYAIILILVSLSMVSAQVQRIVLAEEFSNASCVDCASQNPGYDSLIAANATKVIGLKYEAWWPGVDPMNAQNPNEVYDKIEYYSVMNVPYGILDGNPLPDNCGLWLGAVDCATQTAIDSIYAIPSDFIVNINPGLTAGMDSIQIDIEIIAPSGFNGSNLKLQIALIEKLITFSSAPGTNGETSFHNIMRKMIPGSNGTNIQNTWLAGEMQSYSFTIPVPNYIYKANEMAIVAFIQNDMSREIYQTNRADLNPVITDYGITTNVTIPLLSCNTTLTGLTTHIKNIGATNILNATVNYQVDGGAISTIPFSTILAPNTTSPNINIPTITGLSGGEHIFKIWITNLNGITGIGYMGLNETIFLISDGIGAITPLTQDFSSSIFPYNEWFIDGSDTAYSWKWSNINNGSLKFDNFNYLTGKKSSFIVEPVDLSGLTSPTLNFDVAYCQYASENDRLFIYASTNCGSTWSSFLFNEGGTVLASGNPDDTIAFIPNNSQWHNKTVDLSSYSSATSLFIKFKATCASGNNLYIDNINIGNLGVGVEEINLNNLNIYPNPANEFTWLSFDNASHADVSLVNMFGQTVKTYYNLNTKTMLSLEGLADGMYVLIADINGHRITKKFIKN